MKLRITGMEKVENMFRNLPEAMQKEIQKQGMTFLKAVRKSAKLRAPRFTGYLASSIFVDKVGKKKVILSVEARYAAAMETGAGLPHYVSKRKLAPWFGASRTRGAKMIAPGTPKGEGGPGMVIVRRYKPFVLPALEHNIARLQSMLNQGVKNAVSEARR